MPDNKDLIEERVSNDTQVRQELAKCLSSIEDISSDISDLPQSANSLRRDVDVFLDLKSQFVRQTLPSHPLFGGTYVSKLNHDMNPAAVLLEMDVREEPFSIAGLQTVTRAIKHFLGSVEQEFGVSYTAVDIGKLVEEMRAFFKSGDEILRVSENEKSQLKSTSNLETGHWIVSSQEDVLFRIIYNLTNNSRGAIRVKYGNLAAGGEIKFSARQDKGSIRLDIEDNGIGFGDLFREINLETVEKEISLKDVLSHGEGTSLFKKLGIGGTGKGLGICQHLADLIGAEISIRNPEKSEGAKVSIKLRAGKKLSP